ncbi:hypothetical protein [Pseudoclavibacter sp. AY1H1]|uniref:hypothetical protein n=1 Tax=Pseudoclavibacter sp. AY1H1 TaxID=2080584 RepID=UPI0011B04B9D|nr:hypothetical protein [Pseudoclavibacter sp. AY1H1]
MAERGTQVAEWWRSGVEPLLSLPTEMVAPVLGAAWFGVFTPMSLPMHIVGPSYTGKTSLGKIATQFATDHPLLGPAASAWGAPDLGSTWVGLRRAIDAAERGTFFIDDVVSSAGQSASVGRLDKIAAHVLGRSDGGPDRGLTGGPLSTVLTASIYGHSARMSPSVYRVESHFVEVPLVVSRVMKGRTGTEARCQLGRVYRDWISEAQNVDSEHRRFTEEAFDRIVSRAGSRGRPLRLQVRARVDAAFGLHLMGKMLAEKGVPLGVGLGSLMESLRQDVEFMLPRWEDEIVDVDTEFDARVDEAGATPASDSAVPVGNTGTAERASKATSRPKVAKRDVGADLRAAVSELVSEFPVAQGAVLRVGGRVIGGFRGDKLLVVPREAHALLSRRSQRYGRLSVARLGEELEQAGLISPGPDGKRSQVHRVDGAPRRVWVVHE